MTSSETPGDASVEEPSGRSWVRTVILVGLGALLIYLLWGVFAAIDWKTVIDGIRNLSATAWIALIVVSILRIGAEAWVLASVLPGLGMWHATLAFLAPSAAASVIPGPADLAARFGMYSSWGFSANETGISIMASWVFTTGAKVALPILAAVGLALVGRANADLETIAIIAAAVLVGGVIILMLLLRSEQLARRIGHWAGRTGKRLTTPFRIELPDDLAGDLAERFAHFRETAGVLIRERWPIASAAALTAQLLQFGILLVAMRGVGITAEQLHWAEIFAAFALIQLVTAIPITPGGIGIAEAGYVTLLVVESNRALADAVTAGTLIYRLFSWIIIIPLGGLAWLWWSRTLPAEEATPEPSG